MQDTVFILIELIGHTDTVLWAYDTYAECITQARANSAFADGLAYYVCDLAGTSTAQ